MNHPLLVPLLFAALGPHPSHTHCTIRQNDIHLELPGQESGYAHKWAVIVGANYAGRLRLERTENDAQALAELLTAHFGYDKEHTVVLTGPAATKKAIENALADGKAMGGAGPDDSILFFFAGHGGASKDDDGDLYPSDVAFDETTRTPKPATVLRMEQDIVSLVRGSKARHKLLILDCCGSGAVLRTGRRAMTVNYQVVVPEDVYTAPAFQALTACGETQEASDDAKGGHSPFTYALLQGLKAIPMGQNGVRFFTVNQLFGAMSGYMAGILRRDQTPQCQWLDGGQGNSTSTPTTSRTSRKRASTPRRSSGCWWRWAPARLAIGGSTRRRGSCRVCADEILGLSPPGSSAATGDRVNKATLESAARKVAADHANNPADKMGQTRAGHLKKLLDAKDLEPEAFQKVLDDIAMDLTGATDAEDLHYLAVLQYVLGKDDAGDAYRKALQAYENEALADPTLKPLEMLCLADLAEYHLRVGDSYTAAADCFAQCGRSTRRPRRPSAFSPSARSRRRGCGSAPAAGRRRASTRPCAGRCGGYGTIRPS